MRKAKETQTFDFRPLGLAIREARERAGLSRNDLGDKVFYGERHIADIENVGSHPSFQLFHDLVTMFNISVDEYFYPAENVVKSTARRQIETSLDLLSDNELKIIQGTIAEAVVREVCRKVETQMFALGYGVGGWVMERWVWK